MESQITTNFWGQDSDKAFRYLYDKYAATLRYFSAKYVDDDATIEDIVKMPFSICGRREMNLKQKAR